MDFAKLGRVFLHESLVIKFLFGTHRAICLSQHAHSSACLHESSPLDTVIFLPNMSLLPNAAQPPLQ